MEEDRTQATRVSPDVVSPSFRLNRAVRRIRLPRRWWHAPAVPERSSGIAFRIITPILLFYGTGLVFRPDYIQQFSFPNVGSPYRIAQSSYHHGDMAGLPQMDLPGTQAVFCTGIQLSVSAEGSKEPANPQPEPGVEAHPEEASVSADDSSNRIEPDAGRSGGGRSAAQFIPDFIIKTVISDSDDESTDVPPCIQIVDAPDIEVDMTNAGIEAGCESGIATKIGTTVGNCRYPIDLVTPRHPPVSERTYTETSQPLLSAGGCAADGQTTETEIQETVTDYEYSTERIVTSSKSSAPQQGPFVSVILIAERAPTKQEAADMTDELIRSVPGLRREQIQILVRHSDPLEGVVKEEIF